VQHVHSRESCAYDGDIEFKLFATHIDWFP
jgi:hypothetical protein